MFIAKQKSLKEEEGFKGLRPDSDILRMNIYSKLEFFGATRL